MTKNNNRGNDMTTETKIDTGTDELLCVIRDRVAIITLNRPEARNAMSDNLTPALRTMIKACGENPRCRRAAAHRRGHGVLRRRQRQGHGRAIATRQSSQCPMTSGSPICRSGSVS